MTKRGSKEGHMPVVLLCIIRAKFISLFPALYCCASLHGSAQHLGGGREGDGQNDASRISEKAGKEGGSGGRKEGREGGRDHINLRPPKKQLDMSRIQEGGRGGGREGGRAVRGVDVLAPEAIIPEGAHFPDGLIIGRVEGKAADVLGLGGGREGGREGGRAGEREGGEEGGRGGGKEGRRKRREEWGRGG